MLSVFIAREKQLLGFRIHREKEAVASEIGSTHGRKQPSRSTRWRLPPQQPSCDFMHEIEHE